MTKQISQLTPSLTVSDSDLALIRQGSQDKKSTVSQLLDNIGTAVDRASTKATPADADEFGFSDTEASNVIKKLTWGDIKTLIGNYISTLVLTLTNKTISGSSNTITNLSASNLSTGTVPVARIPVLIPETVVTHGDMGATETFDVAQGTYHYGTLDDDCTFTFTAPPSGFVAFTLELIQGSGGSKTVTWPAGTEFPDGGIAPVLSTAVGAVDIFAVWSRDTGTTWRVAVAGVNWDS